MFFLWDILRGKATVDQFWSLSLVMIIFCTALLAVPNILGAVLPDFWTRVLGIADLISLPVLAITTVKMVTKNPGKNSDAHRAEKK